MLVPLLYRCFLVSLLLSFTHQAAGQDSIWTPERCIAYAKQNNLSIQEAVLNERVSRMSVEESKLSQLPSISMSTNYGRNFGRSIDPTSNTFITRTYDYAGFGGSASVLVFGWFQKRNTIARNALLNQASKIEQKQIERDIMLNITTGYLRILLAKEQVLIAVKRMELGIAQVNRTERLIVTGLSNGQDLAQVRTQLVIDSVNYFKTLLALSQAKIDVKAILNLELEVPFDVAPVAEDILPVLISPEAVWSDAISVSAKTQYAKLKFKAAQKDKLIAKATLLPHLTVGASAGTNYSSFFSEQTQAGETRMMPLGRQLNTNFSQSLSLGVSIPIFSGLAARYRVKRAEAAIEQNRLQYKEQEVQLKQAVYKACNDASTAYQTYVGARSAAHLAETAMSFAQKRFEKGLISAIELLTAQNMLFQALSDEVVSRYDLIFKHAIVEYYRNGMWLKD